MLAFHSYNKYLTATFKVLKISVLKELYKIQLYNEGLELKRTKSTFFKKWAICV